MRRFVPVICLALLALAGCTTPPDLAQPVEPIGDFRLGHNIVVSEAPTQGPMSRDATDEELEEAVRLALAERLERFDGDGLYHLGVKVEAYVLAQPGIPLLLAPRSVMLLAVNIWDNETRERLNAEPIRITAFEGANTSVPFIPSGLAKSRETQLRNLAQSAAQEIEELLRENEAAWFAPKPGRERVPFARGGVPGEDDATVVPEALASAN